VKCAAKKEKKGKKKGGAHPRMDGDRRRPSKRKKGKRDEVSPVVEGLDDESS